MVDATHADLRDTGRGRPRLRRLSHPGRVIAIALLLAAAIGGSFTAGRFLQPPPQATIEAANKPIVVTAEVQQRIVDARASFAGTMKAGETSDITAEELPSPAVVTRQDFTAGSTFKPGDMLAAISGQPYFALAGPLPLYRDLALGDKGDDVTAFQRALAQAGFSVTASGKVDVSTLDATKLLFSRAGYSLDSSANPAQPVTIPAHEFIPIAGSSSLVTTASPVGTAIDSTTALLSVRTSNNYVSFRADAVEAAKLRVGSVMTVQSAGHGYSVKVSNIGAFTSGNNGNLPGRDVTLTSTDPAFLRISAGTPTTVLDAGQAAKALAVPLTAVRQDNDGDYVWRRHTDQGKTNYERIHITVQRSGGGWAAVSPGDLQAGDQLRVS